MSAHGQRFADQVAIITGGSSGIGRETAAGLLAGGARVAIGDIREPQELAENDSVLFVSADMRRAQDCRELVDRTLERWGRVDILFNNVGTPGRLPRPPLVELPEEDWDDTIAVNLKSVYLDRKSTRLNSSHANISYAVFCLKKKRIPTMIQCATTNKKTSA